MILIFFFKMVFHSRFNYRIFFFKYSFFLDDITKIYTFCNIWGSPALTFQKKILKKLWKNYVQFHPKKFFFLLNYQSQSIFKIWFWDVCFGEEVQYLKKKLNRVSPGRATHSVIWAVADPNHLEGERRLICNKFLAEISGNSHKWQTKSCITRAI